MSIISRRNTCYIGLAIAITGLAYVGYKSLKWRLFSNQEPEGRGASLGNRVAPLVPDNHTNHANEVDVRISSGQVIQQQPSQIQEGRVSPDIVQEAFSRSIKPGLSRSSFSSDSNLNLSSTSTVFEGAFSSASSVSDVIDYSPKLELGPLECIDALDAKYKDLEKDAINLDAKRAKISSELAKLDEEYLQVQHDIESLRGKTAAVDGVIQEVYATLQSIRSLISKGQDQSFVRQGKGTSDLIDNIEDAFIEKISEVREKSKKIPIEVAIEQAEVRLFIANETKCELEVNLDRKQGLLHDLQGFLEDLKPALQSNKKKR